MSWLEALRATLDEAAEPVGVFLRDDDAGWADERLFALLDRAGERALPLDLAVIPAALGADLANRLLAHPEARLGLHQHGLAHTNHQATGRSCEFGPSRSRSAQARDIAAGRARLADLLGSRVDPVFTPPWNRCTRETGECLAELGFAALSRESRATPLDVAGLDELPVSVDWFAHRKGVRLDPPGLGDLLARACRSERPVGIMFHHAEMDAGELERAGALLDLLAQHPRARVEPMRDLMGRPPMPQPGGQAPAGVPISHSCPNGSTTRPSRRPCSS